MHRLGLNYYEVGHGDESAGTVDDAMSPHVDHAVFTVVIQDEPGLEVRGTNGGWVPVPVVPGALFVFLGDYLQRWTNGVYRAATHRVRKVATDRISIQYKHRPSYNTVVAPLASFIRRPLQHATSRLIRDVSTRRCWRPSYVRRLLSRAIGQRHWLVLAAPARGDHRDG
ncbi:2OG-Fe(II) oxygenase family protein [Streptomyces sp. NPDC006703]|uniref:2OG-Fe(II) oxygenase family protein n=1 Tax=Streptomyces sp. NPDC006703 TaxID=3364759 RepID=UPI0036B4AE5F